MKKLLLPLLGLFVVVFATLVTLHFLVFDSNIPRYIPARAQPVIRYTGMYWDFLSPSPFAGGKMWISTYSGTNGGHIWFYDIDRRWVLGEFKNASPVFMNGDQTKVLCVQRGPPFRQTWLEKLIPLFERIPGAKVDTRQLTDDIETFWVVDLRKGSAVRVGRDYQFSGAGSSFKPSPEFRYGYNKPSGSFGAPELFIVDLEKDSFHIDPVDGQPSGWWDNQDILVKATNHDFQLYDVVAKKLSPFLSLAQISNFYTSSGLTNDPAKAAVFFRWNGHENEFYLTDSNKRWQAVESFLARIGRPGPALKLLSPRFKFEWSDHLDDTETHYLYTGRESGETNSAVYLRELGNNSIRELVPPDTNNLKNFSIPMFYREGIIYVRSNMLWRMNLDGGNASVVFPPPAATR